MPIINNLELVKAYRKIFFYINFENIEGDYLEFGVYEGSSMISAFYANKSTAKVDGIVITKKPPGRKFIGFDSFEKGSDGCVWFCGESRCGGSFCDFNHRRLKARCLWWCFSAAETFTS